MKELLFATGNQNKVKEIQAILGNNFSIKSLKDIAREQGRKDILLTEPFDTLEANAKTKAEQLKKITGTDCFAEDSGLFANGLNGEPGVFSARYSGEHATDQSNIDLLLKNISKTYDKRAYFKTVIHLIQDGTHYTFTGICEGVIVPTPLGENGFGYDPIFIANAVPERTFAQLSKEEKNIISHRAKATVEFVNFLKDYPSN
jgi:XTP/dITP diphosphohydrolase